MFIRSLGSEPIYVDIETTIAFLVNQHIKDLLGSRREFSPFINQLDEIVYRLTIYIDQSIYKSTSPYIKTYYD